MAVRRRLVRLLKMVLRGGGPIVRRLRRRSTICRWGTPKPARGWTGPISLLVRGRAPATVPVPLVVGDHHIDIALGVVGSISNARQRNAASWGVGSGISVRGNLDAAARAVLQLLDCRTTLANHKSNLHAVGKRGPGS